MQFSFITFLTTACTVLAMSSDQQGALDAHNDARARLGLPGLGWDWGLASSAQDCANRLAASGTLNHCQAAENLAWMQPAGNFPMTDGTVGWVNEAGNYHGEIIPDGDFQNYGHYTQVMWRHTQNVGIAVAYSGSAVYVVAHYDPPGNYVGQTPY